MPRTLGLAIFISVLLLSGIARANQPLSVGFINTDRPPYFYTPTENKPAFGLYIDILDAIAHHSGLHFDYQFLPQARIRMYMKHGRLDLEPGIDRSWRQAPGEDEASIYSDILMASDEVLVLNSQRFPQPPTAEQARQLQLCSVLGFNPFETGEQYDTSWNKLRTEEQILRMLEKQRCDFGLFPTAVLPFLRRHTNIPLTLSEPVATYQLRLRLHKSQQAHLPSINAAIAHLKRNGALNRLQAKYGL